MSHRAFVILLVLLAGAVALSATSFPGALIGFLFALVVVMPAGAIGDALDRGGGPVTGQGLAWIVAGLYLLLVAAAALRTWRLVRRRELNEARASGLVLALMLALPSMGWLSLKAMVGA